MSNAPAQSPTKTVYSQEDASTRATFATAEQLVKVGAMTEAEAAVWIADQLQNRPFWAK